MIASANRYVALMNRSSIRPHAEGILLYTSVGTERMDTTQRVEPPARRLARTAMTFAWSSPESIVAGRAERR